MRSGSIKWLSPRRIRFWLLVLLVLYTLIGFFAVPWAVKSMAVKTAKEDFNRDLNIENVYTNPFTLKLHIDGLVLEDTDDQELVSWERLAVDFAWSSIINRAWTFNSIHLNKPVVQEERFASGETRLTRLAADAPGGKSEGDAGPPALLINELQIEGGEVRFTDNLDIESDDESDTPEQVSLALQDIGLSVEEFTLHKETRSPVRLDAQFADDGGTLAFEGSFHMLPKPALEGEVSIDELALVQAAPYLQYFAGVRLDSGALSLNGDMQTGAEEQPFAFQGAGEILKLRVSQGTDDKTLIGWNGLQVEQIDLNLRDRALETGVIAVNGLSGQVIINEDQTTNFGELGSKPPAGETSDDAQQEESDNPFSFTLAGIELSNSAVYFEDNSLPLPFSTNIHGLNGEVSTISSSSEEPAQLELEGQVEDYGQAQAKGKVHAFHPMRQTNVTVTFRNLKVPEYSPYTVNFAGRAIAGGTMDLDLDYTIDEEKLDGENNLVLRDLELGEQVESSDAMDLPLNLAIALLEDSDGVIDITLPVSGDVSNPDFDISAVISQALEQAVTSVIEAPFSFLADLVGAESEELGQVEFAAGSAELSPPQRERIAELREALNQRPALTLELAGPYSRNFDGAGLKRQKALDALRQRLSDAGRDTKDPSLTRESNQDMLEAMFTASSTETDLESIRSRFTEDSELDALAYRNYLAEQVIDMQSVADSELQALGNERSQALRDALVNSDDDSGIDSERVRVIEPMAIDSVEGDVIALEVGINTK
jgi:hypothetical protein